MTIRILIVDDNADDRDLVRRAIKHELPDAQTVDVNDEASFVDALRRDCFDAVVTDYQLLWTDGLQVLRRVLEASPQTPVIMFTRSGNEEICAEAMRAGLFDYIVKSPQHYVRLPLSIRAALRSTEMRRQLSVSESRYRIVGEAIPFGVWLAGPDGDLQYASPSFLDLLQLTLDRASGSGWIDRVLPEDQQVIRDRWTRCIREGCDWDAEFRVVGRDGKLHTVLSRGRPVRDSYGQVLGWAGINLDITERKQIQQERDHLLDSEREARVEAERANRTKDEFLAMVSHELRTPLNAILGWAQMLQTGRLPEAEVTQGLAVIERNARAQAQLIEDLLDMSRIVSGKLRLDLQNVDPGAAVESAVESVRPSAEAKGLTLQTVLDPDAGPVRGDPGRLQQIVWNLLTNAVKFTPAGGMITVTLRRSHSKVRITVEDTGEGIASHFLPTLFDRFRQADASTSRRHGGLGLGLPLVKNLAQLHGGSVEAHSDGPGRGASFTVTLPVVAVDSEVAADPVLDVPEHAPSLEGLSVLVVEDDADSRDLIERVLRSRDARVVSVESAAAGIEAVDRESFDLIISDIGMPGEDGFSFISRVRDLSDDRGGRTPAVALTAYARAEDRQRALLSGFQMHMSKPIDPIDLVAVVAGLAWRRMSPAVDGD